MIEDQQKEAATAPAPHIHAPASAPVTHDFLGRNHDAHAGRTTAVLLLCAATMVLEIVCGVLFGSMALLADGFHMATHAGVMLVAAGAYRFARQRLGDPSFSFGTGKVGDLAAFASAIILALTAVTIAIESIARLLSPTPIAFDQAIPVAFLGLGVNILSIWLLHDGHDHGHGHEDHDHHDHDHYDDDHDDHDDYDHIAHDAHGHHHHHDHAHHHHDHNFRAAYLHVLSDVAVGVLAIIGLLAGRFFGWHWLDPVMGLVGAYVIGRWAIALAAASGNVLLDRVPDAALERAIRARLLQGGGELTDFHFWRLGPGHHGLIAAVRTKEAVPSGVLRESLSIFPTLSHVTIQVEGPEMSRA